VNYLDNPSFFTSILDGWLDDDDEISATAFKLTNYLKYLIGNKTAYAEYFWWKDFYLVEETAAACNLCDKLTTLKRMDETSKKDFIERSQKMYSNFNSYWYNCTYDFWAHNKL
jgi:hypothetical protein